MKYFIQMATNEFCSEMVEISHRHKGDESAAPYWNLWRKGLRMVRTMRRAGIDARLVVIPQSAADIMRQVRRGAFACRMLLHYEEVEATPARARALKRLREVLLR